MAINIHGMSIDERLDRIGRLWDSLPDSLEDLPVPECHRDELECRIAAADAAPGDIVSWEDFKKKLQPGA